jgi:Fic family protein
MNREDFTDAAPGELVSTIDHALAFLPTPLPPRIEYDEPLVNRLTSATLAIGKLDGILRQLTNPFLLIRPFQLREAIASSQIEGTQTELRQLLLFQAADQPADAPGDVREVSNYTEALACGVSQPPDRKISVALIKEMHRLLLEGVRGQDQRPGELRSGQVWIAGDGYGIGQARFVPPPPTSVAGLLEDLAGFINSESEIPALIRLALVHYQFETIHPFSDGNGRIGRLLIPLLLVRWGIMSQPALYISDFFNVHRDVYVDGLWNVSRLGAWRDWFRVFIVAINSQAIDAYHRGGKLLDLRDEYRTRYQRGRASAALLRVIDMLFESPAITVPRVEKALAVTYPTANKWIDALVQDGVLVEVTQRSRNRIFLATGIYDVLNAPPFFVSQPEKDGV